MRPLLADLRPFRANGCWLSMALIAPTQPHTQLTRSTAVNRKRLSRQRLRRGLVWVRFPSPAPIPAKNRQRKPRRCAATDAFRRLLNGDLFAADCGHT